MEILAIIPARGGSKGIPHKNIVDLMGKPLIQYTIDAALNSFYINRVIVSTDDEDIADVARRAGVEVYMRPRHLSSDTTRMVEVIDYLLSELKQEKYEPTYFILLQPTSPLRTAHHIDEALEKLINSQQADAIVSVTELPHQYSPIKIMQINRMGNLEFYCKDGEKFTTRQELPTFYARNGAAIYAVQVKAYQRTGSLYGNFCLPYLMVEKESIDIDSEYDLEIARFLLSKKNE